MFGRRTVKTRQDLVRAEFGESMELLKRAATHAAGGLGASVGPSLGNVKDTAMNKTTTARDVVMPVAGRVSNVATQGWDSTVAAFAPLADRARQASEHGTKLDAKRRNKRDGKAPKVVAISTTTETETTTHTGLYALLATGVAVGAAGALVARRRTRAKWAEYEPGSLRSDASSFIDAGATSKSFGDRSTDLDVDDDSVRTVSKAVSKTKDQAKSAVDTIRQKIHEATAKPMDETSMDRPSEKINEGTAPMTGKAEAKHNAATPSGGTSTNTSSAAARGSGKIDDEVDDLIRSSKNGRS